jgi:peptide/nickel transport system permease protein
MATQGKIAALDVDQPEEDMRRLNHIQRALYRLSKDYLTLIALSILIFMVVASFGARLYGPWVGIDPVAENLQKIYAAPDAENILGTDDKGRDHLSRLLYGGQVSLGIAFSAAILSLTIGVSLGMLTGYYGGIVDDLMIWFITTLNSIPALFLLLILSSVFRDIQLFGMRDSSVLVFTAILGFIGWTGTMRLVRGETLAIREREYIIAARAMGASDLRIMFLHILPNLVSIVIVTLAIDIGVLILIESGLSFLGFGINPPTPTWGNMLTEAQAFFRKAPHLVFGPGIMITITVLCLYIIGDGMRDALDPTISD